MPFFICPNCKERSVDLDGYDGFSTQALQCRSCAFGFLYELLEDYYPAPETGFVVCDRNARVLAAGRGVFELTGYRDADLIGREVVEALALSDSAPIEVVREWGVRKMGQELEIRTSAGLEKRVVIDFFPAYDDDGGLLLALTPRSSASNVSPDAFGAIQIWLASSEQLAVLREERSAGEELAAILAHRPRRDDTRLVGIRDALDARGHAAEDDVATAFRTDRVGAGAVDRRPDHLRERLGERDRRRVQRFATGDRADAEVEPVLASAADEALAEVGDPTADMPLARLLGDLERDRSGRVELHGRRSRLGDERVAVERGATPSPSRSTRAGDRAAAAGGG